MTEPVKCDSCSRLIPEGEPVFKDSDIIVCGDCHKAEVEEEENWAEEDEEAECEAAWEDAERRSEIDRGRGPKPFPSFKGRAYG